MCTFCQGNLIVTLQVVCVGILITKPTGLFSIPWKNNSLIQTFKVLPCSRQRNNIRPEEATIQTLKECSMLSQESLETEVKVLLMATVQTLLERSINHARLRIWQRLNNIFFFFLLKNVSFLDWLDRGFGSRLLQECSGLMKRFYCLIFRRNFITAALYGIDYSYVPIM